MLQKSGQRKPFDPKQRKARDNARLRKIACNSSDKAARKAAPLRKAKANRKIRRQDKAYLSRENIEHEENADMLCLQHKTKPQNWGSYNAAEHRAERDWENKVLRKTAHLGRKGRGRMQELISASSDPEIRSTFTGTENMRSDERRHLLIETVKRKKKE